MLLLSLVPWVTQPTSCSEFNSAVTILFKVVMADAAEVVAKESTDFFEHQLLHSVRLVCIVCFLQWKSMKI